VLQHFRNVLAAVRIFIMLGVPMPDIRNIAAYKFATLSDLKALRERLKARCKEWNLKGTILLSKEGINLFMAGEPEKIERILKELRALPGLENLEVKVSESDEQPFRRMLVKVKKEIIAFGVEGINPALRTSPKLKASQLKQWLDEGRPVTLLDTRNDYEVKLGTFKNALTIGIDHFRHFPDAVRKLPEEMKEQPIVMFCTGGIRCEKAGPFMEREGFKNVFQLEGGILKYFEDCGSAHYDGECFVFDQRVGVDPSLHETASTQCYACQTPLTEAEQQDSRYVANVSCPYCFGRSEQEAARNLEKRNTAVRLLATPLPGSQPYENIRPLHVPERCDGFILMEFLLTILTHIPAEKWERIIAAGEMLNESHQPVKGDHRVRAGERYLHKIPCTVEPEVNAAIQIFHEDEALIVLLKSAPLPMHAGGRFNRNTLQYIIHQLYAPQKPQAAHRLDANTTGLVLLTRTRHFASKLQPQFTRGEITKKYLVQVTGSPVLDEFDCDLPILDEADKVGSRTVSMESGQSARTEFRVIRRNDDGTSLLEARPITGRTNQIRLHLQHLDLPVMGDPVYGKADEATGTQTLGINDPPLCLHSWQIRFRHPLTDEWLEFTSEPPAWASSSQDQKAEGTARRASTFRSPLSAFRP